MVWYLFRHGFTFFSKTHIPYGLFVNCAPLLPEGKRQAHKIGEQLKELKVAVLFSSPYKRCRQTADIVSGQTGLPVQLDDRLGEQMITAGKESFGEMVNRLQNFINDTQKLKYPSAAVCSHGWPLGIMTALLKKGSATRADLKNPKTGEIVEIRI